MDRSISYRRLVFAPSFHVWGSWSLCATSWSADHFGSWRQNELCAFDCCRFDRITAILGQGQRYLSSLTSCSIMKTAMSKWRLSPLARGGFYLITLPASASASTASRYRFVSLTIVMPFSKRSFLIASRCSDISPWDLDANTNFALEGNFFSLLLKFSEGVETSHLTNS